jgi:hypothetical protein
MKPKPSFDASIPVLTEVFQDQPLKSSSLEASEPAWDLLERRLSERILRQLQGQIDTAMAAVSDEIRRTLPQIVADALAQELAHLPSRKN